MTEPTTTTLSRQWSDPPERGRSEDDFPYPNQYNEFRVEGDLAERVRARVGAGSTAPVYITETVVSGGYSEWTQENDHYFKVECGLVTKEFEPYNVYDVGDFLGISAYSNKSVYAQFDEWLSETPERLDSADA